MRIEKVMTYIEKSLIIFQLLLLLGVAVSLIHSFDTFWQLQSGRYIWQTKSFIYKDIFSLASETLRYEHCWLHDLLLYATYSLGGYAALSWYKGLLITLTFVFAVFGGKIRGGSWLAIALVYPFVSFATAGGWLTRPQLWSFFLFAVFALLMENYRRRPGRYIWLLVPLTAIWANLHAGYVLAYAVVTAYLVGEAGAKILGRKTIFRSRPMDSCETEENSPLSRRNYVRLCLVAAGIIVAGTFTPYGSIAFHAISSATQSSSVSSSMTHIYNMDWRATSFAVNPYFYYTLFCTGALLLTGWKRVSFTDICILAGLAIMGLGLVRHTTFYYIALLVYLPRYVDVLLNIFANLKKPALRYGSRTLFIGVALFFLYYYSAHTRLIYGFMNTGLREWHYPIEASEFVKKNKLLPNIYNTYDWGGYLMWTLYPDYKVFLDGRSSSQEMFRYGFSIMGGLPVWEDLLNRFDVNTIITKACMVDTGGHYTLIDRLRGNPRWTLVFADESSMVFVRNSSVDAKWLDKHRLPESRIDDTIFSEARLLVQTDPRRLNAFWELAQISLKRRDYKNAALYLRYYLNRAPYPDPNMVKTYKQLQVMLSGSGKGDN